MKDKLRLEILDKVRQYAAMERAERKPYEPGERIPFANRVYDEDELTKVVDSALEFWLTYGRYSADFERRFAEYLGVKYVFAVNSGSSANLLAFMALTSPLLKERAIKRGDEVIAVAAAFPTTVAPIVQYGAVPVFADICLPSCNIDVSMLEAALSSKTKAVFLAHTLGVPFDIKSVSAFCKEHGLWLIEDNCDALGAEVDCGSGFERTGTIGDIGTSSFYPAHHMTMGEGGAVYTNDAALADILLSLRDWGRACVCPSGHDNTCGRRFDGQYGTLPEGYDHKYVYSHLGYNLKITDIQAAIGCAQLSKLPSFVEARRANWRALREGLSDMEKWLLLPEEEQYSLNSPFGFVMTVLENSPVSRNELTARLENAGIQTRVLFSGNITRHPCFTSLRDGVDYRAAGSLSVTDRVMRDTFWIGVHPGLDSSRLSYMIAAVRSAFGSEKSEKIG